MSYTIGLIEHLLSHKIQVAANKAIIEYRFALQPKMNLRYNTPNTTRDKEKNTLIARTATINFVAVGWI
jgi:hypothetical protein